MTKNNQAVAPAFEQVHGTSLLTRPALNATDEELKEMRHKKFVASVRKISGGKVKRFKIGGSARDII